MAQRVGSPRSVYNFDVEVNYTEQQLISISHQVSNSPSVPTAVPTLSQQLGPSPSRSVPLRPTRLIQIPRDQDGAGLRGIQRDRVGFCRPTS